MPSNRPKPNDLRASILVRFGLIATVPDREERYPVGPESALSPTFESRYARPEHVGDGRFDLDYMRHTGKWWKVYRGLTLDEALTTIRDVGLIHPA